MLRSGCFKRFFVVIILAITGLCTQMIVQNRRFALNVTSWTLSQASIHALRSF